MSLRTTLFVAMAAIATPALAQYDSGGFESPDFTAGPLTGQDGWVSYADPGMTADVRDPSFPDGPTGATGQYVDVYREANQSGEWVVPNSVSVGAPPLDGIQIDWRMYVEATSPTPAGFGPMFGVYANHDAGVSLTRMGGLFVDASDGAVLASSSAGTIVETGASVAIDTWNAFRMLLNFSGSGPEVSLFLNGSLAPIYTDTFTAVAIFGIADTSGLTEAAIFAGAAAGDANSVARFGHAYFDDFSVTLVEVPEPVSAMLLGIGSLVFLRRSTGKRA